LSILTVGYTATKMYIGTPCIESTLADLHTITDA